VGYGSPAARALASIEWTPRAAPPKPKPKDGDGDGIFDDVDACPDTPGVPSDDPQMNGCPAPPKDADGDGIPDDQDACPAVAGPRTDDPRTTGCPDSDKDGIVDRDDACPKEPGVRNADRSKNGCPVDPDRDKDGVPNESDACPDEAGKPDPDPKRNGCPMAFVQSGKIEIVDQVRFATGRTEIVPGKESEDVLQAVLALMKDHPDIKKVRVEGHTDNQGSAAFNEKLSAGRAASVVDWLVKHGVDKSRLSSVGFGLTKPIADNGTEEGRKLNRRVEFHIEEAP
jgi:outer membrane protein OmpA-like peptidoglycan-associated protein